jgi:multidrug resistance efflux pump
LLDGWSTSISGVFIITYKGKVVLPPIPVVGHVDGVPVASWQEVEVEDVEVALDDGDAEVAEDGADGVHGYAEAAEHRDKKYKKKHKKKHKKCEAVRDARSGVDVRPVRHCFR